jgi:predicted kinase
MGHRRPLRDQKLAEEFIGGCFLKSVIFHDERGVVVAPTALAKKVRDAELLFETGADGSTMTQRNQRVGEWQSDVKRAALRDQIVTGLIEMDRLPNDDEITLAAGGARPLSGIKTANVAILLTGLPASGKSSVVNRIADEYGAYVIDPDYAKRKLPEYDGSMMGASLVHEESTALTLGKNYEGVNLLQYCMAVGANVIRPMVGEDQKSLEAFREFLKGNGYEVHLCVIDLPREISTERALRRFLSTGRYVSLSYIYDQCANDPALTYYRIRADACRVGSSSWASLGAIDTAPRPPVHIDSWGDSPAKLFKGVAA